MPGTGPEAPYSPKCSMALAGPPRSHENGDVAKAIFTPVHSRVILGSTRWHLAPDNAFATMHGTGTKSFVSIEQGRLGRVLACEGGMSHGRHESAAEAGRLRPRRPRHGADRLHD